MALWIRLFCLLFLLFGGFAHAQFTHVWAKGVNNKQTEGEKVIVTDLKTDEASNLYVVGRVGGTVDADPGPGVVYLYGGTYSLNAGIFFAKYDANGQLLFAKSMSGTGDYGVQGIEVDSLHNLYLVGSAEEVLDFDPGAGEAFGNDPGGFLAKYDAQGNYVFHQTFATTSTSITPTGITLGKNNRLVVTGYFNGSVDFDGGPGSHFVTAVGNSSGFFAQYDTACTFISVSPLVGINAVGTTYCTVAEAALDDQNNIFLVGEASANIDIDPGAGVTTLPTASVFFAQYASNGTLQWFKTYSSTNINHDAIVLDRNGNIGIGGTMSGTVDFDFGPSIANLTSAGGNDGYFAKYDNNGNYIYAARFGGTSTTNPDEVRDICFDSTGNLYVTGQFSGTVDFDPGVGVANLGPGTKEIFLAKYGPTGNYLFAKHMLGTTTEDIGNVVIVDPQQRPQLAGYYGGTIDVDPSPSAQMNFLGYGSFWVGAFVGRYDVNGNYQWAVQLASGPSTPQDEEGQAIARDTAGNVYVAGYFVDTVDFDPGPGLQNRIAVGADAFLAKYDASGNYVYAIALSSTNNDSANAVAVDAAGNAYVTGSYTGTVDFDPGPGFSYLTTPNSSPDVFLAKYGPTGNLIFAGKIGGTSIDYGNGIALDASNNIYLTGNYRGTADFDMGAGVANMISSGVSDIFLAKYSSTGTLIYAKGMIGTSTSSDYGYAVAVEPNGTTYLTGSFQGTIDFDPGLGTANLVSVGSGDAFVAKYDANGNYQYAVRLGGASFDEGYAIAFDGSGNAYVTGSFSGTGDFDPGAGTNTLTSTGLKDGFLVKLNSTGAMVYGINIGGTGLDIPYGVAADAAGNAYLAGYFTGTCYFGPNGSIQNLTAFGKTDIFLCKYDPSGNYLYGGNAGAADDDRAAAVQLTSNGKLVMTGSFSLYSDLSPGPSSLQFGANNGKNIFFGVYLDCAYATAPSLPTLTTSNSTACLSDTVTLSVQSGILNDATVWKWYSGSCDGTLVGTGSSIVVHPTVATTYYVRGEGACFSGGACSSITVGKCISGTILHPNNLNPIRYSTVAFAGPTSGSVVTGTTGTYSFPNLTPGGNYTLTPSKANDTVTNNGISTLDLVLMQQHILNQSLLNSPYKILAGDVNNSGSVTTLDIVLTRTVILQTSLTFPSGRLWSMVDASYVFPNAFSPWPFPSTRTYPSVSTQANQNFYGIKLGDVNWSWNPTVSKTETVGVLPVYFGEAVVGTKGSLRVPVLVKNFDAIAGYQFTLSWDPTVLDYVGATPSATAVYVGEAASPKGQLTVSWNAEDGGLVTLEDGSALFFMDFRVVGSDSTAQLGVNSSLIAGEAYNRNLEVLAIGDVSKTIDLAPVVNAGLLGCYPNPFSEETTLRFFLQDAAEARFTVMDLSGRVIATFGGDYPSGISEVKWQGRSTNGNLVSPGCYFVRLDAGNVRETLRLVIVGE